MKNQFSRDYLTLEEVSSYQTKAWWFPLTAKH
jgi:hypothetical protein